MPCGACPFAIVVLTVFVEVSIRATAFAFSSPTAMIEPSPDGHRPCGRSPIGMVVTRRGVASVVNTLT